ncbi:MAG TPA: lysophospholipid acyltransferase family protein [Thermoanaerobaculia bacterium]|nr:lysophospholipid acyltransferase family protein [Thermoanaerobaculia bacterium]
MQTLPKPSGPAPITPLAALARLVLRIFFRELEVVGAENVPAGVPLVLVANHVNGLVDPVLVLGALPLRPRFLGKSTLWKIPVLSSLLDLAGAIPIQRRQDEGADRSKNEEAFARCHEALAAGDTVAIFPEGTSHNEPALQPLKTGAARIALEAERRLGPLGVRLLPVGLLFDARGRFRSRALVRVGEPLDPAPELALYASDPAGAVRALTARVDQALKEVTLNYATWEEARLIARAADLYGRPGLDLPNRRTLEETFAIRRAMIDGYPEVKARFPERTAAVAEAVRAYDRLLRALGLRDDQVAAAYPAPPVAAFVGRTLLRLLVGLPLAVAGTLLNAVPFYLVHAIAHRTEDADQEATLKIFPSLVIYPLCWLVEAWAIGHWGSRLWGVLALLAALPTGYAATLFHERRKRLGREVRAYLLLRTQGKIAAEIRARREEVYRQVAELVEAFQKAAPRAEAGPSGRS